MKTCVEKCGEPANAGCVEHIEGIAGNGDLSSMLTGKAKHKQADPVPSSKTRRSNDYSTAVKPRNRSRAKV